MTLQGHRPMETAEEFRARARRWLHQHAVPRRLDVGTAGWGEGSDSVALFPNVTLEDERRLVDASRTWIRKKADAGFANLTWDQGWGGQGLSRSFEVTFAEEEARFETPPIQDVVGITTMLVAPTIRAVGTQEQKRRFLPRMLRTEDLWCQLYSEPGAGSDLASLTTSAVRDGDHWIVNGQKLWTSGAQFAAWGYALCRTDTTVEKHRGLTAFAISMRDPGVEVRPLRQMTGGTTFNEVFLTDVRVPDSQRLGAVGDGWKVALTTLGFEREVSGRERPGGFAERLISLATYLGVDRDPVTRQLLAQVYTRERLLEWTRNRARSSPRYDEVPGPEGSIGKLSWTEGLRLVSDVAGALLGPRLMADTGEWGTYAWSEHVLGTPGFRIAGGTDEIQRRIIAERALGLPPEVAHWRSSKEGVR